jgi:uncharacterized phage protein gp47/JayE
MPLRTLQISTLENSGVARLTELEPAIDLGVYGSHVVNLVRSVAYAIYPTTFLINDVLLDAFPQTAKGEVLDKYFGVMDSISRKPASRATGSIVIFGDSGSIIPVFTEFTADNGVNIRTLTAGQITAHTLGISQAVNNNGVITITTSEPHLLPKGAKITIATIPANTAIDGRHEIIGATNTTIAIKISTSDPIGAVGVILANYVIVNAETVEAGLGQNIGRAQKLSGGYDAFTTINGLSGAADIESDDLYTQRIIKSRGALEGVFTAPQIELAALSVAGNTRAWVITPLAGVSGGVYGEVGYKPQAGEVVVYFVRDFDNPITPDANEIAITKQAIINRGKMPANAIESDIIVLAPKLTPAVIKIANLTPATADMRQAIERDLKAFIEDILDFENVLTVQQINGIVANSRDSSNNRPTGFQIINGDINPKTGGLLTYGGVQWL